MKGINLFFLIIFSACSSHQEKKDPIREVFFSKMDEYRQCFLESNSYKGRNSKVTGVVKVWLSVNPDGNVKKSEVLESDFKDPNLHACVLSFIKPLKFPSSTEGINITQSLNFKPRD